MAGAALDGVAHEWRVLVSPPPISYRIAIDIHNYCPHVPLKAGDMLLIVATHNINSGLTYTFC